MLTSEGGSSLERRMAFLRILRQLLELDAAFVLSPTQQASRFLLDSYLSILNARSALHFSAFPGKEQQTKFKFLCAAGLKHSFSPLK